MPLYETVLFGVRKGNADWQEEVITNNAGRIEEAKKWAAENGFDRFRVATIDLSKPPDFRRAVRRSKR